MVSVNTVDELKTAISNKEVEIEVTDPELVKHIRKFKSVQPFMIGVLIGAAIGFMVNPLIAGLCLPLIAVLVGKKVVNMIGQLGKIETRQLYFNYSIHATNDKTGKALLHRK